MNYWAYWFAILMLVIGSFLGTITSCRQGDDIVKLTNRVSAIEMRADIQQAKAQR